MDWKQIFLLEVPKQLQKIIHFGGKSRKEGQNHRRLEMEGKISDLRGIHRWPQPEVLARISVTY